MSAIIERANKCIAIGEILEKGQVVVLYRELWKAEITLSITETLGGYTVLVSERSEWTSDKNAYNRLSHRGLATFEAALDRIMRLLNSVLAAYDWELVDFSVRGIE